MKVTVMNSIIKLIAWMTLLAAAGCATHPNQGGTSDTQTSSQNSGASGAPATPSPQVNLQPSGIPDNGSFMNDNGLNRDMLDEKEDWDESNATPNPAEDQEIEEDNWSNSPEADGNQALQLYTKAADGGYSLSQYNLAQMCLSGQGAPPSAEQAFQLFQKAANQNFAPAQQKLASLYESGQGGQQDLVEAYRWYSQATAGGGSQAARARCPDPASFS